MKITLKFIFSMLVYNQFLFSAPLFCKDTLHDTWREAPEKVVKKILSFEDSEKLKNSLAIDVLKIYSKKSDNGFTQAELAFQAYLKHRLSLLNQDVQVAINEIILNRINEDLYDNFTETELKKNWYLPWNQSINLSLFRPHSRTIIGMLIKVHELEHAIQQLHIGGKKYTKFNPKYSALSYQNEKGAMSAEAIYLLSIPKSIIQATLHEIESETQLDQTTKYIFIAQISPAIKVNTVEDYVKVQWELGRYSMKKIFIHQIIKLIFPHL